jgi:hypothetical protein
MIAVPAAIQPVEQHMVGAAAFRSPATTVGYAGPQAAPASPAVQAVEPKSAPETATFDAKRFAIPLLGIFALAVLAIWGTRRFSATSGSGPASPGKGG